MSSGWKIYHLFLFVCLFLMSISLTFSPSILELGNLKKVKN